MEREKRLNPKKAKRMLRDLESMMHTVKKGGEFPDGVEKHYKEWNEVPLSALEVHMKNMGAEDLFQTSKPGSKEIMIRLFLSIRDHYEEENNVRLEMIRNKRKSPPKSYESSPTTSTSSRS